MVCKAMEFGQFPLDKHKCYFILTSCKYNNSNLQTLNVTANNGFQLLALLVSKVH